ncbi:MAG: flippase-like domain-containing protein [Bacteroidales bacterium]|jgi:uncharacterized protein (TIRG00374 family)|nr:flippase-like domain-containing protein [Bacteroidales bacterium]
MAISQNQLKSMFSFKRVLIPILFGVGFSVFSLLSSNFDFARLSGISFNIPCLVLAFAFMAVRDLCYIWRLRVLTDKQIGWRDAFQVIMLWEFASSVTPSMVGGSAFAIFFINAERVRLGKSTAIVMVTALLDELFYILMVAVILLVTGSSLFHISTAFNFNPMPYFIVGYIFIIVLTSIITVGLFAAPQGLKRVLTGIFSLPVLRRWRSQAEKTGDDIVVSSQEMKGQTWRYWLKAFGATAFSWTARFLVLNCLILAANPGMEFQLGQQVLIYAKQLIMWVILLISPTPGASGIAEFSFSAFFSDLFSGDMQHAVALIWRAVSYYPYLIVGLVVLPLWLSKLEKRRKSLL